MSFPLDGNERVKNAVVAALAQDRIPHAILIEGDPGSGRHTLANYLSAAAVCSEKDRPCGECRACKQALSFTHPDIRLTQPEDGKKNISVAQIRELRQEAFVKPHTAARRVFIIDRADSLNAQAQNALLKVLEEPPGSVIFILIAESKASLLETVRSRCTAYSLSPKGLEDPLSDTANLFLDHFLKGEEFSMLAVLAPFSGNRAETDRLIEALKVAVTKKTRGSLSSPHIVRRLSLFYDVLAGCEESLVTNVNLNLLFCSLVSKAAAIHKQ